MSIYSSNVKILNGLKAMMEHNPLMSDKSIWFNGNHHVQHNPRNNKRTKRCKSKRKGR